jgi:PAS domain S-box-containing protein
MLVDAEFYRSVIENLHDGVYSTDLDRRITFWNNGAERLTGYSRDEVMGRPCSDNLLDHVDHHGVSLCKGLCPLAQTLADGLTREAEVYLRHRDGYRVPVSVRVSPIRDREGVVIGAVEVFSDVSTKRTLEEQVQTLQKMALIDPLTSLGNRRYLEMSLRSKLNELKRYGMPFGVLFLDVDRFKSVNDTYGHDVGDQILKRLETF